MKIVFDNEKDFLKKYRELIERGVNQKKIKTFTPLPVKGFHDKDKGYIKYFAFLGSILGLILGIFLTIYTSIEWNEILGGKPPVSIPAFIIIYYELIILLGGVFSFIGFLTIIGLKRIKNIKEEEFSEKYIIEVEEK